MLEFLIVALVFFAAVIWIYNQLVRDRNQVLAAWSDIDVQLKRRHNLVPQLITTVKAYADFEKATMIAVTELRTRSEAASHLPEKASLEKEIVSAIGRLTILAENYPDLKADENFRQLHTELTDIENHIQYARRFYNGAVRIFNTHVQSFPHFLLARVFKFQIAEFFEVENENIREAPSINPQDI
ncbi:MAG: hypothetical protein COA96_09080 [SAR86 cluster bacterium]|uniref:LemA family protein n=1 Tax=SAR86 cluster bacterium TaxID=2030880 RepID=A0A2A5B0Q4_9GAMM|nr:MAG: hypothetical protein COA96_09080 [SAR86 cluster bacterium]